MGTHTIIFRNMLCVQRLNNFHLLATSHRRLLDGTFGLEQTGTGLLTLGVLTLGVAAPVAEFTTVPTLRSALLLLHLVAVELGDFKSFIASSSL